MNNEQIILTNIQRFSLHDGPGIRTTVFLKGCSLCCPWCSNPENIDRRPQAYTKDNVIGIYGKYVSPDELARECLRDKGFYDGELFPPSSWAITCPSDINRLPGGVTFSGGEPLLQMEALVPVCERLKEEKVHIAIETSLFCPPQQLRLAMEMVDLFYVDMKILDKDLCFSVESGNLGLYLSNLNLLMNGNKSVVIRIPVIGTYTDGAKNRWAVRNLLNQYRDKILKIELIKEHSLGESKYKSLGMEVHYNGVSDAQMETYQGELDGLGILVEICRI